MMSDQGQSQLSVLQNQLSVARTEISNLRKELKSLKYSCSKEITNIADALNSWRCPSCKVHEQKNGMEGRTVTSENGSVSEINTDTIKLQPIGFINTGFVRKRAVPRQANVNLSSHGKITLFNHVFTNPEHSLEGLDGFSHMWILFHFHKNESNYIRAKVAPPRLNGARIGVFGTRSPHRPCPIGLSLVQIDKIDGSSIYFSGVDMVDGTPVLDLKPYIPHYDNPAELTVDAEGMERLELDGQESEMEGGGSTTPNLPLGGLRPPLPPSSELLEREAPDGEEEQLQAAMRAHSPLPPHTHVRVPEWISQSPVSQLQVTFTPQVESDLTTINGEENVTRVITDILREDPRSVYLRDRYANQFYTFLINGYHVSCKFDDNSRTVKVFRILSAGAACECGVPQWQCSTHGEAVDT